MNTFFLTNLPGFSSPDTFTEQHQSAVAVCYRDPSYLVDHLSRDRILRIPQRGSQKTEKQTDGGKKRPTRRMNFLSRHGMLCLKQSLSEPYFLFRSALKHTAGKQQYITSIHHLQRSFQEHASTRICWLNPWTLPEPVKGQWATSWR